MNGYKTSTKGTVDPGVRAIVVTAGHCTHAELTVVYALASLAVTAIACTPFRVCAN